MDISIPLEGLYLYLIRNGFPLSVRDYQDALTALRRGYGLSHRKDLHSLCEMLWVRTDHEASLLDRLFRQFPWPSPEEIQKLAGSVDESTDVQSKHRRPTKEVTRPSRTITPDTPTYEFAAPSQLGVGLPRATTLQKSEEVFIFSPRPLVSLRSLIIAWRRFRIAQRSGPPVELDINATVKEQCLRGTLIKPVLLPARRNQARLVVLIDSSPSMITWHDMNRLIAESLTKSQFAHTALYFFDNTISSELYELENISRPIRLPIAYEIHNHCALLIVSDAGATRGRFNRGRHRSLLTFLTDKSTRNAWRPIAWLNPMPQTRWAKTTAEHIARFPGLAMFQLNDDGLIRAIDYLRGKEAV